MTPRVFPAVAACQRCFPPPPQSSPGNAAVSQSAELKHPVLQRQNLMEHRTPCLHGNLGQCRILNVYQTSPDVAPAGLFTQLIRGWAITVSHSSGTRQRLFLIRLASPITSGIYFPAKIVSPSMAPFFTQQTDR